MKKTSFVRSTLLFMAGVICGAIFLGLLSFSPKPSPGPGDPVLTKIPVTDAQSYYQKYFRGAVSYNQKLKGFTFEKAALTAMNTILNAEPSTQGFRIIFGVDNSGNNLAMICAVDANGVDLTSNVYSFVMTKVGPCPPVCDVNSPITQ